MSEPYLIHLRVGRCHLAGDLLQSKVDDCEDGRACDDDAVGLLDNLVSVAKLHKKCGEQILFAAAKLCVCVCVCVCMCVCERGSLPDNMHAAFSSLIEHVKRSVEG
jgi:hypothetical protein